MAEVAIDSVFIQSIEHRPKIQYIEAQDIPIIDLSPLNSPDSPEFQKVVAQIGGACEKWGFFQVINHGVPENCKEEIQVAAKEFFHQPREEKLKVGKNDDNPFGFHDKEHTKNIMDWKEIFDLGVETPIVFPASHEADDKELRLLVSQWPLHPPNFREACQEYSSEMKKLAHKLLELISQSLGLPAKRLTGLFKGSTTYMRLNYYPVCPLPDLALGIGRHKDSGVLTIISQDDVGGLEVKRKSDGEWVRIKPTPNAYVVNIGDIFQVWSNDKYESVEHRAMVNSKRERYSIPFFFNPAHHVDVEPLSEFIDEENPPKYQPYNWGKFRATRYKNNLKKPDGENIQIHQFKK
jgi:isopenicillin N synthase-like dioxygenase